MHVVSGFPEDLRHRMVGWISIINVESYQHKCESVFLQCANRKSKSGLRCACKNQDLNLDKKV